MNDSDEEIKFRQTPRTKVLTRNFFTSVTFYSAEGIFTVNGFLITVNGFLI